MADSMYKYSKPLHIWNMIQRTVMYVETEKSQINAQQRILT